MRRLSEIKKECVASCENCGESFIDDIYYYGSISCPNGCGNALLRKEPEEWKIPEMMPVICGGHAHIYESRMMSDEECTPYWGYIWYFAPESAKWVAMDDDGEWSFYTKKPRKRINSWCEVLGDDSIICQFCWFKHPDWKNSLMERPEGV